jgi:hypothetical protein
MSAYITADNYQVQSWPPRLQGPHLAFMQAGQHYDSAFAYLFTNSRISLSKESRRQNRAATATFRFGINRDVGFDDPHVGE